MIFAVRLGHQRTGNDIASVGILNEYNVIRAYGYHVIEGLRKLGHTVYDVTPPENNRSLSDSLNYGINEANRLKADYFISLHANSFSQPSAHGSEVIYQSDSGLKLATNITKELEKLGFSNRGAKPNTRGLSELKKTNAVAIIAEPFFVSSPYDVELYKKIGPQKLGYTIAKGITGKNVPTEKPKEEVKEVNKVEKILVLHNGGADQRAAEYLSDFLQCPTISKANSTGVLSFYDRIIVVGGNWKPTGDSILITGSDRYETLKAVLKYIKKL